MAIFEVDYTVISERVPFILFMMHNKGFPGGSMVKNPINAEDSCLISNPRTLHMPRST